MSQIYIVPSTSKENSCGCRKGSLKKVAEAAGVHQSTASIILRNRWAGLVKLKTVERVRAVAKKLGYQNWYRIH